jgi:hypothetical protein
VFKLTAALLLLCSSFAAAQTAVMKVIMLPDNQYYSEAANGGTQAMNLAQVSYASSVSANAIISVGDNYNNTANSTDTTNIPAWVSALNATGIPWISPPGNHDYDTPGSGLVNDSRVLTTWNSTVGAGLAAETSFKASYPGSGANQNAWIDLGQHGAFHWAAMSLEFCATNEDLTWANGILNANPTYQFIITTHSYLSNLASTGGMGNGPYSCTGEGFTTDYNEGSGVWNGLVKAHDKQVRFVLCGHWNPTSAFAARQREIGSNGYPVDEIYFDAQSYTNGGNGFLRVMTFNDDNTVNTVTYSPVVSTYLTDYANQFTVQMQMPGSAVVGLGGTQKITGTAVIQ